MIVHKRKCAFDSTKYPIRNFSKYVFHMIRKACSNHFWRVLIYIYMQALTVTLWLSHKHSWCTYKDGVLLHHTLPFTETRKPRDLGKFESRERAICCWMPRATTDRFSRAHRPSAKSGSSNGSEGSSAVRNPIFNTERYGQHILKNPLVAQRCVSGHP